MKTPSFSCLGGGLLLLACAAAQAQPMPANGVQLFGIIDMAAGRFAGPVTGINSRDTGTYRLEDGGLSTSRWGVRGNEDLGGGYSASFELSSFIRSDTGQSGRSDAIGAPVNVAADPYFSRASWVGLSSAALGRVRFGNVTSLLFVNSITSNAFGDSTTFSPLNLVTFVGSPLTGGGSWTNAIFYDSPSIAGVTVSAAKALSERNGGGNSALRAVYAGGPLSLSGTWQRVKRNPLTFADGTSPNDTSAWQLGAGYDFGFIRLQGHLGRIQNDGTAATPLNIGYRIREASVSVPVGVAGQVLAGYGVRSTSDAVGPVPATAAGGNESRKVFTVGYDHNLSKRTDIYLMAVHDRTLTRTLPAPATSVQASGTTVAVGVRHRF